MASGGQPRAPDRDGVSAYTLPAGGGQGSQERPCHVALRDGLHRSRIRRLVSLPSAYPSAAQHPLIARLVPPRVEQRRWAGATPFGVVMLNLDHGPWAGHKWFAEMVAGAEEYMRVSSSDDPIFASLLPHIVLETGMSMVDVNTKAQRDELFKSLSPAVQHKQDKVGTSRWFQFIHAMESFLKIWSRRQCIGLSCSLQLGLFAKGAAVLKVHLKPRDADKDVEKSSTKEDMAEVQRARSAAKNTMEFVTAMLADRNLFSRFSIIVTCARPSLELYHEYNVNNRSAKESLKWNQDRAMDLGLPCINATIELLGDVGLWDKIGVIRSVNCAFTRLRFAEDHPVERDRRVRRVPGDSAAAKLHVVRCDPWTVPSIHCRW